MFTFTDVNGLIGVFWFVSKNAKSHTIANIGIEKKDFVTCSYWNITSNCNIFEMIKEVIGLLDDKKFEIWVELGKKPALFGS